MSGRVVVIGSLNVDATAYVADFAAPGETITAHGFQLALGGKGANQAVAAHAAGGRVELIARVGDDANGALALTTLGRLGLETAGVQRATDAATGVALITVAASGENTVVVAGGANLDWTAAELDALAERIGAADAVLTQGELPVPAIDRIAELAAAAGTRFVLNLAPPVAVASATLAIADPLIVNEHEARTVGIAAGDSPGLDAWLHAAELAVSRGLARSIVVTLGAAGAIAVSGADGRAGDVRLAVAAPTVVAVDTTGAGDGFTGTLTAFLAEGRGLPDAVRHAVAAASLAVQARGTVDSYAPRERVIDAAATLQAVESPAGEETA
ncbi:ribokinase [Agromyces sp. G08B096]|uniref:Ribokinase n=1 Tax=Agromyces sp. G08B096 TaxID=3156399 RepID=A0AAU7W814_9MICO